MSLVTAALALRRKVFASLPWGYRLANLLIKLARSDTDGWAQTVYGLFLMYGVTDMPPINGQPAELSTPATTNEIRRKLPSNYGSDFGGAAYGKVLKVLGNMLDAVPEVMQDVVLELMQPNTTLAKGLKGKPLGEARAIIMTTLGNRALNRIRGVKREESLTDDEGLEKVIKDQSYQQLGEVIPERVIKLIERDLARSVNPKLYKDLPLYFKLLVDGYEDSEILKNKMLPFLESWGPYEHKQYVNWQNTYKSKIKKVLERHLKDNN
jgi:hypothetical protein